MAIDTVQWHTVQWQLTLYNGNYTAQWQLTLHNGNCCTMAIDMAAQWQLTLHNGN